MLLVGMLLIASWLFAIVEGVAASSESSWERSEGSSTTVPTEQQLMSEWNLVDPGQTQGEADPTLAVLPVRIRNGRIRAAQLVRRGPHRQRHSGKQGKVPGWPSATDANRSTIHGTVSVRS